MKPLIGRILALATCAMLVVSFVIPFTAFARYVASHTICGPDYYTDYSLICGKCHTQQFEEQATAEEEYPSLHSAGARAECGYCHGRIVEHERGVIVAANCTDCHAEEAAALAEDVHAGIYEQLDETPEAASATCIACHAPIPVTIEDVKVAEFTLRIE